MTPKAPARMTVVKKEEKEFRLHSFLERALSEAAANTELCLLAQGSASPVSRAVAGLAGLMAERGVTFRVVLAKAETTPMLPETAACSYRHLADVRCHDAHELLIFGPAASWVGDSMRRNPSATDSYELHIDAREPTSAMVASSFERLWAIATPMQPNVAKCQPSALALAGRLAALSPEGGSVVTALTRH